MHLFYIDESGTGLKDDRTPFFVLAAVGIPISSWRQIDEQITALKRRLIRYAKPEDWEIKGRDMRQGNLLFSGQDWGTRMQAIRQVVQLIQEIPCSITVVQVDTRDLPEYIRSPDDLYRVAFWRLLDEIDAQLSAEAAFEGHGLLMLDNRSDLHSSLQDRRVLDAYREWVAARDRNTRFIELPWFGFSAFYAGLQLADFAAYMVDFATNERPPNERATELQQVIRALQQKVTMVHIP